MSRRSLFLLAAVVVMLYFSIIMFMLSPLNGARGSYYERSYMNSFAYRQLPVLHWCKELRWRSPPSPYVVALSSYPGSGNTWLRYLLQQATGIVTGSIYMDYGLRVHGFPAENVTDGSVLVVKTHEYPPLEPDKYQAALLLIRNPRDAILADFNRLHKGHIGTAPKSAFTKKSSENKKPEWSQYVARQLPLWVRHHELWLTAFRGRVHVVYYTLLVNHTRRTLMDALAFLNQTVSEGEMNCAISNKEGIYRRKQKLKDFDPYTPEMYRQIDMARDKVFKMILDYQKKHYSAIFLNVPAGNNSAVTNNTLVEYKLH